MSGWTPVEKRDVGVGCQQPRQAKNKKKLQNTRRGVGLTLKPS